MNPLLVDVEGIAYRCCWIWSAWYIFLPLLPRFWCQLSTIYSVPSVPDLMSSSLSTLFSSCDAVSLHVHVTPETRKFITKDLLSLTKPSFSLINTSRGAICDEISIAQWLKSSPGHIYATDVIDAEIGSNVFESPLVNHFLDSNQLILTPHIGGMTYDARNTAYTRAAQLLSRYLISLE